MQEDQGQTQTPCLQDQYSFPMLVRVKGLVGGGAVLGSRVNGQTEPIRRDSPALRITHCATPATSLSSAQEEAPDQLGIINIIDNNSS